MFERARKTVKEIINALKNPYEKDDLLDSIHALKSNDKSYNKNMTAVKTLLEKRETELYALKKAGSYGIAIEQCYKIDDPELYHLSDTDISNENFHVISVRGVGVRGEDRDDVVLKLSEGGELDAYTLFQALVNGKAHNVTHHLFAPPLEDELETECVKEDQQDFDIEL